MGWPHLRVLLYPVRVQGKGAEGEIARAVRYLSRSRLVDVVLVVRGGGSLEDLWAFNEEMVARAIAACLVPVISGVGHEVDFTIADFVADIRAAPPTQAAEIVVARLEAQERRLDQAASAQRQAVVRRLEHAVLRLRGLEGARGLARLPGRGAELDQRLRRLEGLPQMLRALVVRRHRRLEGATWRLLHWPMRFGAPRRREVVVREVTRELEPQLTERGLQVDFDLPRQPLPARIDPSRFKQVLRNILANAIKFSPRQGRIQVLAEPSMRDEPQICISDQGPGIPPDECEAIFEAFVQSSGTKDGAGGTGLGLTICRKIVEAHGGRIHATNAPGGGARFCIVLSAREARSTVAAALD